MHDELFDKYVSGSLSPEEEARLAQLLKQDPSVGEALVRHVRETALMVQVASQLGAVVPSRRSLRPRALRSHASPWTWAVAAACLLFGIIVLVVAPPGRPTSRPTKLQEEIRTAEAKLREIDRKEQELAAPTAAPAPDPLADRKREEERAQLRAERERIEREMRLAIDRERVQNPSRPEKPEEKAAQPPPVAPPETRAAVATVRELEGEVTLSGKRAAVAGQAVLTGEGMETGAGSRAVLEYADGTRVTLGPETRVKEFTDVPGKRLRVERGSVGADVTRQPAGKPLVFVTPQGEATVLGTTLRLVVDDTSTRLEVTEGKVRLKRLSDGKAVEVASGHSAVAATGLDLVAKPNPIDEILLLPLTAKRVGKDWGLVADAQAAAGKALEAPAARLFDQALALMKTHSLGYAEFAFAADADKTYHLWIRGQCTAAKDRDLHDGVMLEIPGSAATDQFLIPGVPGGSERVYLSGFAFKTGYTWVCRAGDYYESRPALTVRFGRSGPQKLRLYGFETPVRIDALWLSATQTTRPADGDTGPKPK